MIIVITTIKMISPTIIFLYNYSQFHHRLFSQCKGARGKERALIDISELKLNLSL